MFLEELNRRIHESGLNLRLPCIPYNTGTSLSLRISRMYLATQTTFQGSKLSPSYIILSFNACCSSFPDKYCLQIKTLFQLNSM